MFTAPEISPGLTTRLIQVLSLPTVVSGIPALFHFFPVLRWAPTPAVAPRHPPPAVSSNNA